MAKKKDDVGIPICEVCQQAKEHCDCGRFPELKNLPPKKKRKEYLRLRMEEYQITLEEEREPKTVGLIKKVIYNKIFPRLITLRNKYGLDWSLILKILEKKLDYKGLDAELDWASSFRKIRNQKIIEEKREELMQRKIEDVKYDVDEELGEEKYEDEEYEEDDELEEDDEV